MTDEVKNLKKITGIIEDLEKEMEEQKTFLETSIRNLKTTIRDENSCYENTIAKYNKEMLNLKNKSNSLLNERNFINSLINEDDLELKKIEIENVELRGQLEKNEIVLKDMREIFEDKQKMNKDLKKKIEALNKIKKEKEERLRIKVDEYKKFLGINLEVIKDQLIKVSFGKICKDESFECSITLDLSNGLNILEIYPKVIDVDKINYLIKDRIEFFELLKTVRREFVREFCK